MAGRQLVIPLEQVQGDGEQAAQHVGEAEPELWGGEEGGGR